MNPSLLQELDLKMNAAIALLSHSLSAKRRSGAKQLRKLGDPRAGVALLEALKKEIKDVRTWETQYQMIMAIGECDVKAALPYLHELAAQHFEATMVYTALGDALLRLSRKVQDDADIVMDFIAGGNPSLICGSLQAVAMLRMVPSQTIIAKMIDYALAAYAKTAHIKTGSDWSIVWTLRAAPGWQGPQVDQFLKSCADITFQQNQQIHSATQLALAKKYDKWSPL
jgi:PBS lyase HEAT-like repeat